MAEMAEEEILLSPLLNNKSENNSSGVDSDPSAQSSTGEAPTIDQVINMANFEDVDLNEKDKSEMRLWVDQSKEWCALVVGRAGTGKSTLLNGFVGEELFKVGHAIDQHGTKAVFIATKHVPVGKPPNSIELKVIDTPGFHDESKKDAKLDAKIIEEIKKTCEKPDLLIYCIDMKESRHLQHEYAIKKITSGLGVDIWDNSIVVLTFANVVASSRCKNEKEFKAIVKDWQRKIVAVLKSSKVPASTASKIKFVPAGVSTIPQLPGIPYWFTELWMSFVEASSKRSQPTLMKVGKSRLVDECPNELTDNWNKSLCDQKIIIRDMAQTSLTKNEKIGFAAGAAGAAAGGATVGASIGAVIGALAIGIPSFGTAAGVGLGLGAAVGGGIGAGAAATVGGLAALYKIHKNEKQAQSCGET